MDFRHGSIEYFLNDEWWAEAGMGGFRPSSSSFRSVESDYQGRPVQLLAVADVGWVDAGASSRGLLDGPGRSFRRDR